MKANNLKYIIESYCTVLEALQLLNSFDKDDALTLFVVENNRMVGTLTDGDIRRKLVDGIELTQPISFIMHREFKYLRYNSISVSDIHTFKKNGLVLLPVLDSLNKIVDVINLKQQRSFLPIDAVLMAGGKGERLRPLTETTPKPLLKVGSKAIIDYNVDSLISFGVRQIFVTVNYLREQIEEHFLELRKGVKVSCVREPKYLGTIGSIKFIGTFYNDTVLVMNSDLFTNINYEDFYMHFIKNDADMSVAVVPYTVVVPYGIFDLEGRKIKGLVEKPVYNYYANAGIYLIKKELLELIPNDLFFNATDFIEVLINQNRNVIRYPITGYWIDIGKQEEYLKANELVRHIPSVS